GAPRIMTTEQLQEAGLKAVFGHKFFLPQQPILEGRTSSDLPLDPYVYGVLLGDGSLGGENLSLSNPEPEIQARAAESAAALGTPSTLYKPSNGRCPTLRFHRKGALANVLEQLGARVHAADKYVHEDYLRADERTRRELLAGLLDTDGSPEPSAAAVEYCSASPRLAEDVAFLTRSLGGAATESGPSKAGYRNSGKDVECRPRYRVRCVFPADGPNPFNLPRKAEVWGRGAAVAQRRQPHRAITSIEPAGSAEVCCIELEPVEGVPSVYLTDRALIPTHNTGKTISTVLGLLEWVEQRHGGRLPGPVVVVTPSSVVHPWVETVSWIAPHLRVVDWRGPKRYQHLGQADVYVTSYDTARQDAKDTAKRKAA